MSWGRLVQETKGCFESFAFTVRSREVAKIYQYLVVDPLGLCKGADEGASI